MSWSDLDDDYDDRPSTRCQCGNPDWPGSCPGPAACPCCEVSDDDEEVEGEDE